MKESIFSAEIIPSDPLQSPIGSTKDRHSLKAEKEFEKMWDATAASAESQNGGNVAMNSTSARYKRCLVL